MSRKRAGALNYVCNVLLQSFRQVKADAFRKGSGPDWDAIRKLLDDPDAHPAPHS